MKRQPIEVYGFGHRLPTRTNRATRALVVTVLAAVGFAIVVLPW